MYRSFEFSRLGLELAAHAAWSEEPNGVARLAIASLSEGARMLAALPEEERTGFAEKLGKLKTDIRSPLTLVEGNVARSLTSFLGKLDSFCGSYEQIPAGQELLGFWDPPEGCEPGQAIVMGYGDRHKYWVQIVDSKKCGRALLGSMKLWLPRERAARLEARIAIWNCLDRSENQPCVIRGAAAELLCKASMASKIVQAASSPLQRELNKCG